MHYQLIIQAWGKGGTQFLNDAWCAETNWYDEGPGAKVGGEEVVLVEMAPQAEV